MFCLMTTYGLRACDVVALTLDNIRWRNGCISFLSEKTGNPLELPLTPVVSSALYDYLKHVPRYGAYRQVFLRIKAPGGTLKATAVTEAFQACSRNSGLTIPFQGANCLRHSYAIHLLRQGQSLKTICDIVGTSVTGKHCSLHPACHRRPTRSSAPYADSYRTAEGGDMTKTQAFQSSLAAEFVQYISLKQALGRRFETAKSILVGLDRFLYKLGKPSADLTSETFKQWCDTKESVCSNTRLVHMRVVRNPSSTVDAEVPIASSQMPHNFLHPILQCNRTYSPGQR